MPAKVPSGRTAKLDEMLCRGLEARKGPLPSLTQLTPESVQDMKETSSMAASPTTESTLAEETSIIQEPAAGTSLHETSPLPVIPQNNRRKVKIGELLIQEGVVTPEQIEQALVVQKDSTPGSPV
jgi:hypothetical protein